MCGYKKEASQPLHTSSYRVQSYAKSSTSPNKTLKKRELGHKGDGSLCAPEGAQREPSPVKSPALSIT